MYSDNNDQHTQNIPDNSSCFLFFPMPESTQEESSYLEETEEAEEEDCSDEGVHGVETEVDDEHDCGV
jgi:hypothetical protein